VSFSETIPEFFQRKGSVSDTEDVCPKVPDPEAQPEATLDRPVPEHADEQPVSDTPQNVQNMNPVTEGDLGELRLKDTHNRTTCARASQLPVYPEAVIDDEGDGGFDAAFG
jgi:hypothetical protein